MHRRVEGAAQPDHELAHFRFQPQQVLHRDVEEIARAARGIEHFERDEPRVVIAGDPDRARRIAGIGGVARLRQRRFPLRLQHVHHRRLHQPLDIGPRGVVRAQLGAFRRGQHLFEQGAEDRRFDRAPVLVGGDAQDILRLWREVVDLRAGEQVAVEIAHDRVAVRPVAVDRLRIVHPAPQVFEAGAPELVGAPLGIGQEALEAVLFQQLDVFGEHAEQRAHQEQAGRLDPERGHLVVGAAAALVFLQRLGDPAEQFGDVAGDARRTRARIDTGGVGPDRPQRVGGGRLDPVDQGIGRQVRQRDAVAPLVGEGAITAPVARPVEIEFERAADVGHDQERRGIVIVGQRQRIALRLQPGVFHQPVVTAARLARLRHGADRCAEQVEFGFGLRLFRGIVRRGLALLQLALLGFEDEVIAFVEVDPLGALATVDRFGLHGRFELVIPQPHALRVRGRQPERDGQLGQEHLVIGALGPAFLAEPFFEQLFDGHAPPTSAPGIARQTNHCPTRPRRC